MDNPHGLTAENLLRALPDVLRNDNGMSALAEAIAGTLSRRPKEIEALMIYARIDALPEELLNILAFDFKVDWWDAEYTLEEKRKTLKDSWHVHRTLGTKYAVETAISAIYRDTVVQEWFEYGGEPYHFKLLIDATYDPVEPERHRQVIDRVAYYKNLRSVLDSVDFVIIKLNTAVSVAGEYADGVAEITLPPVLARVQFSCATYALTAFGGDDTASTLPPVPKRTQVGGTAYAGAALMGDHVESTLTGHVGDLGIKTALVIAGTSIDFSMLNLPALV